jgi:hypothetical protein
MEKIICKKNDSFCVLNDFSDGCLLSEGADCLMEPQKKGSEKKVEKK